MFIHLAEHPAECMLILLFADGVCDVPTAALSIHNNKRSEIIIIQISPLAHIQDQYVPIYSSKSTLIGVHPPQSRDCAVGFSMHGKVPSVICELQMREPIDD